MEIENGGYVCAQATEAIISAAIEVHKSLGAGLLEAAYESCLAREFVMRGIPFRRQVEIPVLYKGEQIDCGFRVDLLVFDSVLVELKAIERILPVHEAQLMTYMKLTRIRVGLLINFNVPVLKDGIRRRVL